MSLKIFRREVPSLHPTGKPTWASFSPDSLRNIMSFSTPQTVAFCERVCATWKKTINESVWKTQCQLQGVTRKNVDLYEVFISYTSKRVKGFFDLSLIRLIAEYVGHGPDPKRDFADPQPFIAFDASDWEKYYGNVNAAPKLPWNIHSILKSTCLFWPTKSVSETHVLVLVSKKVNDIEITIENMQDLVANPKQGKPAWYDIELFYAGEHSKVPLQQAHWVLMAKKSLPGTSGFDDSVLRSRAWKYNKRVQILMDYNSKFATDYRPPKAFEVIACIFCEYVRSGKSDTRLFPWNTNTWKGSETSCEEELSVDFAQSEGQTEVELGAHIQVGYFGNPHIDHGDKEEGLLVTSSEGPNTGLCALRRF